MLNEIELAKLTNTLQIPLIVQDIMDDEASLTPDVQYGLHEVLSNYQPDSALLCIALSARKIAGRYQDASTIMKVLKLECDRIIADYAELWIQNAENKNIDDNLVFDTLEAIPEDLEGIAELLEVGIAFLQTKNEDLGRLCEVLAIQARAQVLIADTFIDLLDQEPAADTATPDNVAPIAYNDNVIAFPGTFTGSHAHA